MGGLNSICSPDKINRNIQLKWQIYWAWGADQGLTITYTHPLNICVKEKMCFSVFNLFFIIGEQPGCFNFCLLLPALSLGTTQRSLPP